jgi:hypothetical protein
MFKDPEFRRSLRNLAVIMVTLILLWFVWVWAERFDAPTLREAMRWALGIVSIFALSVGMENGLRAFKFKAGKDGIEAEADGD